ncbi:helix-turn-helix domain-containing protein [Streptomyces sp. NBC_00557]|uniref:helix-turn-helix domain-containing protein n=1 Tax=Streptomyces sp. NBC_00557 TaxID=2975776 RepID=UPI002E7FDDB9|nr:DUF2690 domain-containing protein [Streptomyces sp. NBC_00557]WUC35164.1 XRE family transcriptional regulator [Streptomyces sp. NBC_00557]
MPRWKVLPEELDPQIREFTSQMRRLVDRSGLSVAALADRTGYSKTSWERYLGGRLLAPKGAVVALAEVTGASPVHLTTMWELAERAWSRAEMRYDRTMEAIRIAQARAALGEFGAAEATGGPSGRKADGAGSVPGVAGPSGISPTIPTQPTAPDADARDAGPRDRVGPGGRGASDGSVRGDGSGPGRKAGEGSRRGSADGAGRGAGEASGSGGNSWGLAGYRGPSRASGLPGADAAGGAEAGAGAVNGVRPGVPSGGPGQTPTVSTPYDGGPEAPRAAGGTPAPGNAVRQRVIMFLAGLVGVAVVIGAVFFLTDRGGTKHRTAARSTAPTAAAHTSPPPGVRCTGSACDGKDAEAMGCSGELVTTAKTAVLGTTTLEVRYSKACGTAWGRITGAAAGDRVQVVAGKARQSGQTSGAGDTIAYTPMVAVRNAAEAKACATLASGRTGCTK